jgi:hypothetical protein
LSEDRPSPLLTPRLAFGLVALFGLGSLFLLQAAQAYRSGLEGQLRDLEAEIQSLQGSDTAALWTGRRDEAVRAKEAWTARHWAGETAGIASAAAQTELMGLAQRAKVESIKADVSSDPLTVSGQELIRFELIGMGDTEAFGRLLVSLSAHPRIIVVTELDAPFRDAQKSRISVAGYLAYLPSETPAPDTPD